MKTRNHSRTFIGVVTYNYFLYRVKSTQDRRGSVTTRCMLIHIYGAPGPVVVRDTRAVRELVGAGWRRRAGAARRARGRAQGVFVLAGRAFVAVRAGVAPAALAISRDGGSVRSGLAGGALDRRDGGGSRLGGARVAHRTRHAGGARPRVPQ